MWLRLLCVLIGQSKFWNILEQSGEEVKPKTHASTWIWHLLAAPSLESKSNCQLPWLLVSWQHSYGFYDWRGCIIALLVGLRQSLENRSIRFNHGPTFWIWRHNFQHEIEVSRGKWPSTSIQNLIKTTRYFALRLWRLVHLLNLFCSSQWFVLFMIR